MSHIFNNQQAATDGQMVFFLCPRVDSLTQHINFYIKRCNTWDNITTPEDFILSFPASKSIEKATNEIAMSRRGIATNIYFSSSDKDRTHKKLKVGKMDCIPPGYAFMTYEGSSTDVGFIISEKHGIMVNENYHNYGRLIKL